MKIEFKPIGIIHTPFEQPRGVPIQPAAGAGVKGTIEIFEEFREGLRDLEGFSHIIVIYHLHRSRGFELSVTPFLDTVKRGLFATRAPRRPNPIGISVVKLNAVEDGLLHIENLDIIDGTPLLDIKPYVPEFDGRPEVRIGWLEQARKRIAGKKSDERFE